MVVLLVAFQALILAEAEQNGIHGDIVHRENLGGDEPREKHGDKDREHDRIQLRLAAKAILGVPVDDQPAGKASTQGDEQLAEALNDVAKKGDQGNLRNVGGDREEGLARARAERGTVHGAPDERVARDELDALLHTGEEALERAAENAEGLVVLLQRAHAALQVSGDVADELDEGEDQAAEGRRAGVVAERDVKAAENGHRVVEVFIFSDMIGPEPAQDGAGRGEHCAGVQKVENPEKAEKHVDDKDVGIGP
mmetsp:Transcript_20089/g.57333  ORF Transcript_20089/g.57333 Transcript_20089/m.57333 type:complete len:253 (-) Transcript_20089:87-845(-)